MLKLSGTLIGKRIMSLRTGRAVATVQSAIINPDNLKIEGFYCTDSYDRKRLVLLYQDIRDLIPEGFLINDHDVLVEPHELVRLKKIMEIGFDPVGKRVVTLSKQTLGKVSDYAVEPETMYIQKLYVSQRLLKSFTGGGLAVDRSQINEITARSIIIEDPLERGTVPASAPA